MKILFCDIDGVLNNITSHTMYFSGDDSKYGWDLDNLNNLTSILNQTECKLVWSTNWRIHPYDWSWGNDRHRYRSPFLKLRQKLKEFEFSNDPCCPHRLSSDKYTDINDWLNNHKDLVTKFIVIDDMDNQRLEKFKKQFFKIDPKNGLTKEISEKIISYFNS